MQEHIKSHSGAPTELTLDQISAAEIKDFPHFGLSGAGGGSGGLSSSLAALGPLPGSPFSLGGVSGVKQEEEEDRESEQDRRSSGSGEGSSEGSASLTPDRGQREGTEYEQQFVSSLTSLQQRFSAEKGNGQLSRNQPQDLSTSSKKPDDGSQKDCSPRLTPSPLDRTASKLDDQRSPSPLSGSGLDPVRPDLIPKSAPMNIPFSGAPLDLTPGSTAAFPFNLLSGSPFSMMAGPPSPSILAQLAKAGPPDLQHLLLPPAPPPPGIQRE